MFVHPWEPKIYFFTFTCEFQSNQKKRRMWFHFVQNVCVSCICLTHHCWILNLQKKSKLDTLSLKGLSCICCVCFMNINSLLTHFFSFSMLLIERPIPTPEQCVIPSFFVFVMQFLGCKTTPWFFFLAKILKRLYVYGWFVHINNGIGERKSWLKLYRLMILMMMMTTVLYINVNPSK